MYENSTSATSEEFDILVNDEALEIFEWISYSIICEVVDLFGTITNIINIICFIKLDFKDPVNVSLFGLAISDLGCLIPLMWTNICLNPAFNKIDLQFEPVGFQYLTGGWPHVTFTRVTAWITAFITLERCLCIMSPFKVKNMITPKRVSFIIICIFVTLLSSTAPVYIVNKLTMITFPNLNKTLIGLVHTENRGDVEKVFFSISNVFIPFTAFGVIIVCTVTLVVKLRKTSAWRKSSTHLQCNTISIRDKKIVKMVVAISSLFIVCFIPVCINFIAMCLESEFSIDGKYRNINLLMMGIGLLLESVNSSVNIFIYYHMSSKYKSAFLQIFHFCWRSKDISKHQDFTSSPAGVPK